MTSLLEGVMDPLNDSGSVGPNNAGLYLFEVPVSFPK